MKRGKEVKGTDRAVTTQPFSDADLAPAYAFMSAKFSDDSQPQDSNKRKRSRVQSVLIDDDEGGDDSEYKEEEDDDSDSDNAPLRRRPRLREL